MFQFLAASSSTEEKKAVQELFYCNSSSISQEQHAESGQKPTSVMGRESIEGEKSVSVTQRCEQRSRQPQNKLLLPNLGRTADKLNEVEEAADNRDCLFQTGMNVRFV